MAAGYILYFFVPFSPAILTLRLISNPYGILNRASHLVSAAAQSARREVVLHAAYQNPLLEQPGLGYTPALNILRDTPGVL